MPGSPHYEPSQLLEAEKRVRAQIDARDQLQGEVNRLAKALAEEVRRAGVAQRTIEAERDQLRAELLRSGPVIAAAKEWHAVHKTVEGEAWAPREVHARWRLSNAVGAMIEAETSPAT